MRKELSSKICEELKQKGFPQKYKVGEKRLFQDGTIKDMSNATFVPRLDDLIEVCGEEFEQLILDISPIPLWCAGARGIAKAESGSTPEEAVANLWLDLNKQNVKTRNNNSDY